MQATQMTALVALIAFGMIFREMIRLRKQPLPDYVETFLEKSDCPKQCHRFLVRGYTISYLFLLAASIGVLGNFLLPSIFWEWITRIGLIAGILWMFSVRFRGHRFIKQEEQR